MSWSKVPIREIENALLQSEIDVGVHSLKDLPVEIPAPLELAAFLPRGVRNDVIILGPSISSYKQLHRLKQPSIATGSLRRTRLIQQLIPNAKVIPIRGNIDTRLQKLNEHPYDALILAQAGLQRLELLDQWKHHILDTSVFIPSPCQGTIALECRKDTQVSQILAKLDCNTTTRSKY